MTDIKPIETHYNGYRFRSRLEARWAVFFDALGVKYEYEPEGFQLPSGKYYLPDFRIKCHGTRGSLISHDPCRICTGCKYLNKQAKNHSEMQYWFDGFCEYFDEQSDRYAEPDWIKTPTEDDTITQCERRKQKDSAFDLWVEVKGKMTQEDANKILEFAGSMEKEGAWTYFRIKNPVLIVGDIPNPEKYYANSDNLESYDQMNGIDIYPWNYFTIDGDYFAAYPAVEDGCFYLDGDDSNYQTMNYNIIRDAFRKARQARFEHGETPTI